MSGDIYEDDELGAKKNDAGKPQLGLISREFLELMSHVREFGAKKYEPNGWRKGFKVMRSLNAALRHIYAFVDGEDEDSESGLLHLGHAACSLEHALHDIMYRKDINDDRFGKTQHELDEKRELEMREALKHETPWEWDYPDFDEPADPENTLKDIPAGYVNTHLKIPENYEEPDRLSDWPPFYS